MNDPASTPQNTERLRDQLFGARLEAAESRMDARLVTIEATLAGFMERLDERFARIEAKFVQIDAQFAQIDIRFARMEARLANIEATVVSIQNSIGGLKTTMIVTAIGAVIGIATFNATVLSSMITAFETGKNVSEAQARILRQSEETAKLLKQIQQGLPVPAGK